MKKRPRHPRFAPLEPSRRSQNGLSDWLPTIVKGFRVSNTVNDFINLIPWVIVAFALWIVPARATATGKQTASIVGPALISAACLVLSVYVPGNALNFACLCGAAAGLAAINSVGNLGGFIAQNVVPWICDQTGSNEAPMLFLAACLIVGGMMTFAVQGLIRRHRDGVRPQVVPTE